MSSQDKRNGMSRYAKSLSRKAEPLLGRRLHADTACLDTHCRGKSFAHERDMWRELRALGDHRTVNIPDIVAVLSQDTADLTQKLNTVSAEKAVVIVGKKLADIAECGRAEKRVHKRVRQNIRVGVTEQTLFIAYLNAAEDELSPLDQTVNVIPVSYTHRLHLSHEVWLPP